MTDYAILRFAKLKSWGQIAGSLSHNYRTRDTPNADSDLSYLNEHTHETTQDVKNYIKNRLPEKYRKDAVMCLEHLFTASPTWDGWGTEKETEYFESSKKWLEERYGKENVIATSIHKDETTPHLIAYVVPLDEKTGRLNAKKWTGGGAELSKMQTNFAKNVEYLGLKRGIENSKAEHVSIQKYYSKVNKALEEPEVDFSKLPEPTVGERFSPKKYAERVVDEILPDYEKAKLLANEAKKDKREVEALREIAERAEPYLTAISDLPLKYKNLLDQQIKTESNRLHREYEKQKQQETEQYEKLKGTYYEFEKYVNSCVAERTVTEKNIKNREVKTEKWINKKELTHDEIRENRKKLGQGAYEIPDYYITPFQAESFYEHAYKRYKQKVAEKAETENIASVVFSLKEQSTEKNVLKDLSDFDEMIQPVITEFKLETEQQEQRRIAEQQNEQRGDTQRAENERIAQEALEKYQNDIKLEAERMKAVLKNSKNNESEKKIDRDNDLRMQ